MRLSLSCRPRTGAWGFFALGALCAVFAGCEGEAGLPKDGTPVVDTKSDAYRKALDETEKKIKSDAEAEAKARSRKGGMIAPE